MNPYQSERNPDNKHENKCVKNVIHSPSKIIHLETEDALLLGVVFLRSGGDPSERVLLVDLATGSLLKDSTDKPRFFSGTFELLWKIKVRQKLKLLSTLIA